MKLIYFLLAAAMIFSVLPINAEIRTDMINWTQMLPEGANITLNGGDILGQEFATQFDTIVYPDEDFTELHAIWGGNRTDIVSPTIISPDYNTLTIRAAINATPENGTILIAGGPYYCKCDLNCTPGAPSYPIYYWTAFPIIKSIKIVGMGINATTIYMAEDQYSATRPALLFYEFCPYRLSGGDGVGPGPINFEYSGITLDGNIANQEPYYFDGAGLFLSGSPRGNLRMHDAEFRNSPNHGLYLGYNGGGWENRGVLENIYTHGNWGGSQIDNSEDTVIDHWFSEGDGYGFWTAGHQAIILDGMMANSGHLMMDNVHIRDGCLYVFGFQKARDDLGLRISNLYIDASDTGKHGIYLHHCNNVTISDGTIIAGPASYAVSALNVTGVTLDDLQLRGLRGIVTENGYRSDVKLDGCDINTTGSCFVIGGTGSTALFTGCDLYTSSASQYLVNVQSATTATMLGCRGTGDGLVYVGGTGGVLNHAGTSGLGLEAHGSASVADGGTIAHGMKITPRGCVVMPTLAGTDVGYSLDATHITVDFANVTTTQTVSYWAWY